jgi:pyridoxal phosphate enzyme (YggS family)
MALADLQATVHFLGHLQSNKARRAVSVFDRVDSVDSAGLAQKLHTAASDKGERLPVLVEVHLGGEATKSGANEADLLPLTQGVMALPHLELRGLMTIPPYFDDPEQARPFFRRLRELRDGLSQRLGSPLPALSMGMSHDFEVAIEEGATEIRIGSAIFGHRVTQD